MTSYERGKLWRSKNREKARESLRIWQSENREKTRESARLWYHKNLERGKEQRRIRRLKDPEKSRLRLEEFRRIWKIRNPHYSKDRRATDLVFKLTDTLRGRMKIALKGKLKAAPTRELVGCSTTDLRAHLESQFRPGMTLENHGSIWHIDHIRPCISFDLTDPAQQRACFHWSNLQPLFVSENLAKGAKYAQ